MNHFKCHIDIRPIQSKDNAAIKKIIQKNLKEAGLDQPGTAYFDPYLGNLYEFYAAEPVGEYWIALDKIRNKIIGGVGIAPFGSYKDVAELQKYYLLNEYQNLGIGRSLYDKALSYAQQNNYKSIYIETMDRLAKANKVYGHYGFKPLKAPLVGSDHGLMNKWFIKEI